MGIYRIRAMQLETEEMGRLQIRVTTASGARPIAGAKVAIYYTGEPENEILEAITDESGQTEELELNAPPLEYSVNPSEQQPYSEYTIEVSAEGFEPVQVAGAEILPEVTALQEIHMRQMEPGEEFQRPTIGCVTRIISKTWLPAKSMPPGPTRPFGPIYWRLCPLL